MTTHSDSEGRQNYVVGLVSQINNVLAGEDMAEAATALTLAVVCQMVTVAPTNSEERVAQADAFAAQVRDYVRRDDIVEWIRHCTTHIQRS